MNESDMLRAMRQMIRTETAKILMGQVVSNASASRTSSQRFGESPIENMRRVQPYGFGSRAPSGTQTLVVPIAGDPTHLITVGDFDDGKPAIQDGESVLYGADGQVVYMKSGGRILVGSQASAAPAVLGDVLKSCMDALFAELDTIVEAIKTGPVAITTTPGNPAPTHPTLIAAMTAAKTALDNMKSQYVDTASSNFLAQKIFVERGA